MKHYWRPVLIRIGIVLICLPIAFVALQTPMRDLETWLIGHSMNVLGARGIRDVPPGHVVFVSHGTGGFLAVLTPSCSALAPVLALTFLVLAMPVSTFRRRLLAVAAATTLVFVGNIVRIDACLAVGMVMGRSVLVLFHDWVASAFGFAYAMAGFIVAVAILLPGRKDRRRLRSAVDLRTDRELAPAATV